MKISINKTKLTATIILVLLTTSVIALMATPINAQDAVFENMGSIPLPSGVTPDLTLELISHLSFSPTTVGVGQQFIINIWQ
jgi:hypothetical protein